jgi:hypothetical protein
VWRERAKEVRAEEAARKAAERRAARAAKIEAQNTRKAIQTAQKGKRKASRPLQASAAIPKRRRVVVAREESPELAPVTPPKPTAVGA